MNGSSPLPQYTFDPATQQYRMMTPAEQAQKQQQGRTGLGGLYDAGGGTGMTSAPSSYSMSPETAVGMQNFGFAMQGIPSIAAQVAGAIAQGIPSAFGYATPSPVANPSPIITTPIAPNPTETLAAMNAASGGDSDDEGPEGTVSIGAIGTEGLGEEGGPTSAADAGFGADAGVGDAGVGDGGGGDGAGGDGAGGDGAGGDGGGSAAGSAGTGDGEREGGMIRQKRYAEGGIASLANKVEGEGRRGDSMLVHMSPDEVKGLQYLAMRHGGSLTINPKTGLVEANFLKSILPMVAGAALAATGVGAPLAALMVGGGATLMTGSLQQGLMAGLGAFGGAGLAGSLSAAGAATTAGQTLTPQLAQAATVTPQAVASGASPYALSSGAGAASGMGLGTGLKTAVAAPGFAPTLAPATQVAGAITPAAAPVTFSNMGSGIKALGTEAGRAEFMRSIGGATGLATKVGAPLAAGMFSAEEPDTGGKKPQEYIRPYGFDYKPSAETDPNFKFRTGVPGESTAEQRYFNPTFTPMGVYKAGTEPGPSFYGTPTQEQLNLYSGPRQGDITDIIPEGQLGSGLQRFQPAFNQFVQTRVGQGFSAGGITALKKGRFLDDATDRTGQSDGMSDDLPAVINGTQPARLTDGEFVVPADVVSHLGNGSSKAGAKRLHVMMDRIRKARTGTKKQAPAVKAERFMPA
jgi:hypothetical protein